jgi:hypothetical protein
MRRDLAENEKDAREALSANQPYANAMLFLKECGLRLRLSPYNRCVQYNEHPPGVKAGWFGDEPFRDVRDDWLRIQLFRWLQTKKRIDRYGVVSAFEPSMRELNELLKALKLVLATPEDRRDNVVQLRR